MDIIPVTLIYSLIYSFIMVYIRQHPDSLLNNFLRASKLRILNLVQEPLTGKAA
jgi:hypothetical protein